MQSLLHGWHDVQIKNGTSTFYFATVELWNDHPLFLYNKIVWGSTYTS